MQKDFARCLANVLVSEGGYSDDRHDPGGATMNGITQAEYDSWRVRHGLPKRWVRYISLDERNSLYREDYWDRIGGDNLPAGLDYAVFDEAVNSGVARALHTLRCMAPGETVAQEIEAFDKARLAYLEGLPIWRYFGKGWSARVRKVGVIAQNMAIQAAADRILAMSTPANAPAKTV
jgi:lysozyme family protein